MMEPTNMYHKQEVRRRMANMLDYLDWRGDLTLEQSPFNEVDNLILSHLAHINFDYIVPPEGSKLTMTVREAAERYFAMYREERIQQFTYLVRITVPLFQKLAKCVRFADAKLSNYQKIVDPDQTKQFAALHIELSDGSVYISYRGTDSTLVGWKENFNMGIMTPVPSQFEALRYLEDTAEESSAVLRVGGHSKGGNLAVYAAVMCKAGVKRRIVEVYNNDGPGFEEHFVKSDAFRGMHGKIRTIIPQFSVVGMLLEHGDPYAVVKSSQTALKQHDAFSWEVLGTAFVRVEQVSNESKLFSTALNSWLEQLDRQQRVHFVTALFELFEQADIKTIDDLTRMKWKKGIELIRALNQSQENKIILTGALKLLFREGKNVYLSSRQNKSTMKDE